MAEMVIKCSRCGELLEGYLSGSYIEIEPCTSCLSDELEEGKQSGWDEGYNEGYEAGREQGAA